MDNNQLNNQEKEVFKYNYSAKEQEELKRIREKYMPLEENKMEQLRRLDSGVTKKGTSISLVVGIIGALILGIGMCCCMIWGETQMLIFIVGIVIGIIGMVIASVAYPLYSVITKNEREKIAPEIIRLTEELMK